ncbi:MAG: FAD-dependent oxidoreductase [Pyrobaculum sp.]
MRCASVTHCEPQASREEELDVDVLIVGGGLGGLAAALELRRYGYSPKIVHLGMLGGHHVLGDAPRYTEVDIQGLVNRARELDISYGFFDGFYIYSGDVRYRARYRHLILATGGVDIPITFPQSLKAPQKAAEEVLTEPPSGLNVVVWGTTEWGLRTALSLKRDNEVVVLDNSAYLRDVKYYEKVRPKLDITTSVRLLKYDGGLAYEVITEKGRETSRLKVDLIVSTVRIANPLAATRLGFRVFYSFELNSLVPRRSNYGELLTVEKSGRSVGGSNVYATGHLYGALRESHIVEQGKLLAAYIASKDGVESLDKTKELLDKYLVQLTIEANWLYNLGNRLERGTDDTGRYVEPNVIDVPHWASFWPQIDEVEDFVICPCDGTTLGRYLEEVKKLNRREVKIRITHDETDALRQLNLPKLVFTSTCGETVCMPYAAIILGAVLAQKPSYFLYGKPQMLYA